MIQDVKILLGSWVLNKIKHDESFKHQLSDFEQFLNTENKTESNRQKDKDLFKNILFEMTIFNDLSPGRALERSLKNGHHLTEDRDRKLFNL